MILIQTAEFDAWSVALALQQTKSAIDTAQSRLVASMHRQQQINSRVAGIYLKMDVLAEFIQQTKLDWKVV